MRPARRETAKSNTKRRHTEHEERDDRDLRDEQPVPGAHHALLPLLAEQGAVQDDRREPDHGREPRERDEHEVQHELVLVELAEPRLEGECEQEAADELGAGERDPQLLEDVVPVAVAALGGCLMPAIEELRIAAGRDDGGGGAVAVGGVGVCVEAGLIGAGAGRSGMAGVHARS